MRRYSRGVKRRWVLVVSACLFLTPALFLCGREAISPDATATPSLRGIGGLVGFGFGILFLVSALVLWIAFALADAVRHQYLDG